MTYIMPQTLPIRQANKDPAWSGICDDVFDEFINMDDPFYFDATNDQRCNPEDLALLYPVSDGSEQFYENESPPFMQTWEPTFAEAPIVEAKHPQPKESLSFWTKTMKKLERGATDCEVKQKKLRATKSHSDFRSMAAYTSPPPMPASPTKDSHQRRASRSMANEKRRNGAARSVSRGRPTGVTKSAVAGSADPHATMRRHSVSPSKMSFARAKNVCPTLSVEDVPPIPARYDSLAPMADMAANGQLVVGYGQDDIDALWPPATNLVRREVDELYPLTTSLQHSHINTPMNSPADSIPGYGAPSFFDVANQDFRRGRTAQRMPMGEMVPVYPDYTTHAVAESLHGFDFGFSHQPSEHAMSLIHTQQSSEAGSVIDPAPFDHQYETMRGRPIYSRGHQAHDSYGVPHHPAVAMELQQAPVLVAPSYDTEVHPVHNYRTSPNRASPTRQDVPTTPQHQRSPGMRPSHSPSPAPATEPRSSKRVSQARQASRGRRSKSTHAQYQRSQSVGAGGFVNFTAHDSSTILSGVAPSGSGKTKARREREEVEKRKKLSQAAVRAVIEAGGDLTSLTKAGVLV